MPLRLRLTLGLALTLFFSALGLGTLLLFLTAQELRASFVRELSAIAEDYTRLALQAETIALREPPASPLLQRFEGLGVWLLDESNRVVDHLGNGSFVVAKNLRPHFGTQRSSVELGDGKSAVITPIFLAANDFRLAYHVVLVAEDASGEAHWRQLFTTTVVWLLLVVALAWLVGWALTRWLTAPLNDIAHAAVAVQAGDLNTRIARASGNDEISRLKQNLNAMLSRLSQLVVAQQRFTSDAAHDLRTPVATLRTELEVALRHERDTVSYRAVLLRLHNQVQALGILADDMLTLARLEMGMEQHEAFVLDDVFSPMLLPRQTLAKNLEKQLLVNVPKNQTCVGDGGLLARAVGNLLDNALRNGKQKVQLRAQQNNGQLWIDVIDDGTGVPPEMQERLFDRFAHDRHSKGSGLGLAIVAEVARAHGGTVRMLETSVGSWFRLELPCVTAEDIKSITPNL